MIISAAGPINQAKNTWWYRLQLLAALLADIDAEMGSVGELCCAWSATGLTRCSMCVELPPQARA